MTPRPFQEQKVAKLSEARKPHVTINKKSPTETSVELFIVSNPGQNRRARLFAYRLIALTPQPDWDHSEYVNVKLTSSSLQLPDVFVATNTTAK